MIYLKWWKRKTYNQEHSTQQDSFRFDGEIKKPSRQAKVNRIQQHQTNFTTNTKETSLGRKHKRRKRPTEKKPKTITKTVIRSYILIIALSVNGLNTSTKDTDWLGRWKHCPYALPLIISLCLISLPGQIVCNYFILLS